METRTDIALFRHLPKLHTPWVSLGDFPTPLEELPSPGWLRSAPPMFVKREDLSSPLYGGNKVRTLEAHFGEALRIGAEEAWATGAYGSNHAAATVIHARRVGLKPGAMLWPQPPTATAQANLRATLSQRPYVWPLASVVTLPLGMARLPRIARKPVYVMSPGGATTRGAIAHASAALELGEQCREKGIPSPHAIVLAVGSTCTTAGLLAGVHLARTLGIAFVDRIPKIHAVRVTPWPVTSRIRIATFAAQTLAAIERRAGISVRVSVAQLHAGLAVDRRYLGRGYGRPTPEGLKAIAAMASVGGPNLDVVYSGKSAAAFFELMSSARGPMIFWSTKSSAPLPKGTDKQLRLAPRAWKRWLSKRAL